MVRIQVWNEGVYASHAEFTTSGWSREVRQLHKVKVEGQLGEGLFLFGENMEGIQLNITISILFLYFWTMGWLDSLVSSRRVFISLDIPTVPVLFKGVVETEKS
jgi:hypothetical protein